MKKTLLTAAVAATVTLPMIADAKVTIYGRGQVEITSADGDTRNPLYLNDNGIGRVGFKATEKLGNGLTGIAHWEFAGDTDDNSRTGAGGALTGRVSYVGLKGSFGFVGLGSFNSPYKTYGGVKWDAFNATQLEARNGGGLSRGRLGISSFVDDVVYYETPNMSGFQAAIAYNLENSDGGGADNGYYSVAAKYKNGPMELVAGYGDNGDAVAGSRWKVGGKFTFAKKHSILGQYEEAKSYTDGLGGSSALRNGLGGGGGVINGGDAEFIWLAYIGKFGNNILKVDFGNQDHDTGAEVTSFGIALRHKMSKTFSVWGGYKRYDVDFTGGTPDNEVDVLSVGMRKDFKASIK